MDIPRLGAGGGVGDRAAVDVEEVGLTRLCWRLGAPCPFGIAAQGGAAAFDGDGHAVGLRGPDGEAPDALAHRIGPPVAQEGQGLAGGEVHGVVREGDGG